MNSTPTAPQPSGSSTPTPDPWFTVIIREPLRPRPIYGAVVGVLTGGLLAMMASLGGRSSLWLGYLILGAIGGSVIGAGATMLRQRDSAGFIVTLAFGLAAPPAFIVWKRPLGLLTGILWAVGLGVLYAIVFWRYEPSAPDSPKPPSDDKIPNASGDR